MRQKLENGLFEVRKLGNQKNQFVNLNHLGNGKNYFTVWEIKDSSELLFCFVFFLFPVCTSSFVRHHVWITECLIVHFVCEKLWYVVIWRVYVNIYCENCGLILSSWLNYLCPHPPDNIWKRKELETSGIASHSVFYHLKKNKRKQNKPSIFALFIFFPYLGC